MKLQTQIMSLGMAGAVVAALVGAIGLVASARMGAVIEDAVMAGHALKASQMGDMMHDAIRDDAQRAMLGALERDDARIGEAQEALQDHATTYNENVARLEALPLSTASAAALAEVKPLIAAYIDAAGQVVKASRIDAAARAAAAPRLQTTFEELEEGMAALSESIEKDGEALNAKAQGSVVIVETAIGVALLTGTGLMVLAALLLARRMTRPMAHAVEVADQLAQGNLTAEVKPAGSVETVRLLQALSHMQTRFAGIVREVQASARDVAGASAQIAHANLDMSGRTERQAGSLQQTAATMEQLGGTVRNNADNARQANELAMGASSVAVRGGEVMGQVVQTMSGINDSSRKIADIISVIDGIAFQTNILALNAAVEAARAGEQGRGFAVVAGEVRSLAQRSAAASREVKTLVNASVECVEQGTMLVGQAGRTMEEIVQSIRRVTDIVAEISTASAEQSQGVGQVSQAVSSMEQTTQQTAAFVEQGAAAAQGLDERAQKLVQAVAAFRV
jgi:methyl-accepting chemotaxis protein